MKKVTVTYFAMLKEISGKTDEQIYTTSKTIAKLYSELQKKYNFPIKLSQLAAAVNDTFVKMNYEIKTGDNVVFIPPVAGG